MYLSNTEINMIAGMNKIKAPIFAHRIRKVFSFIKRSIDANIYI